MDYNNVKYKYIKSDLGVITIASVFFRNNFYCGIAYQSKKDKFEKYIGREISLERLRKSKYENDSIYIYTDEKTSEILNEYSLSFIARDIIDGVAPYRFENYFSYPELIIRYEFFKNRII